MSKSGGRSWVNVSLRRRMIFVVSLAGLPGIVIAVFLTAYKLIEERRQLETGVGRLATIGVGLHENVLMTARTVLDGLVESIQVGELDRENCRSYLQRWIPNVAYITSATRLDAQGETVCEKIDGDLPYSVKNSNWFSDAVGERQFTVSDYFVTPEGTALLIAASPVMSDNGEVTDVVALGISLNWLDFISSDVNLPPEGTITAINGEGSVLTHRGASDASTAPLPSEEALKRIVSTGVGTLRADDETGATRVYGFTRTKFGAITVIVGLPQFVEYAEWGNALMYDLVAPLAVLLLALLAAGWASEVFVTRHVRSLITTADEIAAGNLDARSEVDYDEHELGELAAAVDSMAEAMEDAQLALERRVEDNEVIARELQHRIGNTLALVQALARQTKRHTRTREEFDSAFGARVQALAASSRLLAAHGWKTAELRELLQTILKPYQTKPDQLFHIDGPTLWLGPRSAMALSLTVHELATNAVKHGALSRDGGRVTLEWSVGEPDDVRWVTLEWREAGGPENTQQARRGFGSRLAHTMIEGRLGGRFIREFETGGLVCTISIPLRDAAEESALEHSSTR